MPEDDTILIADAEIERLYHEAKRARAEAAAAWLERQLEMCEIDDSDWDAP